MGVLIFLYVVGKIEMYDVVIAKSSEYGNQPSTNMDGIRQPPQCQVNTWYGRWELFSAWNRNIEVYGKNAAKMEKPPLLTALIVTPDWSDAEYFSAVTKIPGCLSIKLTAGEYVYENATSGMSISARQNSWLFVMTNYKLSSEKIKTILDGFKAMGVATKLAKYGGRGVRRK